MYEERFARRCCQFELREERAALISRRRKIAVVVEPCLTHCEACWPDKKCEQRRADGVISAVCLVGVRGRRRIQVAKC
jgi:hypothetical protein